MMHDSDINTVNLIGMGIMTLATILCLMAAGPAQTLPQLGWLISAVLTMQCFLMFLAFYLYNHRDDDV